MKTFSAVVAIAALGFGAANASANGNGNTSSNSGASAPHHGSATATTVAPLFNGIPHYYGTMPYRPAVSYRNGSRTLNYPAVGVSTLRRPMHSGANGLNRACETLLTLPLQLRRRVDVCGIELVFGECV